MKELVYISFELRALIASNYFRTLLKKQLKQIKKYLKIIEKLVETN